MVGMVFAFGTVFAPWYDPRTEEAIAKVQLRGKQYLALARLASAARRRPLDLYVPTIAMYRVHKSTARLRFVRAPNQVGKTWMMAAEIWWAATNTHPYRHPIAPGPIWVMLANLDDSYTAFCEKLRAVGNMDELHPRCTYVDGAGFFFRGKRQIMLKNGRRISFKSGEQDQMALESETVSAGFIDEVPKPGHMSGFLARMSVNSSPVLMNFTPVDGGNEEKRRRLLYLRNLVEGDPDRGTPPKMPGWEVHRPVLSYDECLRTDGRETRTKESIENQIATTDEASYNQRILGEWEGTTTDRRFSSFTDSMLMTDEQTPSQFDEFRVGIDHGEGDGKEIAVLLGIQFAGGVPSFYALAEYSADAASGPAEDSRGILAMLESCGLGPYDVTRCFGDINSAGKLGEGAKYNQILESHLAALHGSDLSPIMIETPNKRGGSVNAGESAIHHAMREGRFFVHRGCRSLLNSIRNYRGPKDKDLKDAIDALRYSVNDYLLAAHENRATIARG